MKSAKTIPYVALLLAVPAGLALVAGASRDANAQYVAPPNPPGYVSPAAPPSAYIATVQPEYYENHPVYFYNGLWYYRDGRGGWNYYHNEPAYLHDRHPRPNDYDHRYHYHR
jgi:hypothetical protein